MDREELQPAIVQRCVVQDPVAFRLLVARYETSVFACLSRIVGRCDTVEDLAQEVFFRAFRAFPRFDCSRDARLSTWLLTIATRVAIDARRQWRSGAGVDPDTLHGDAPDPEGALRSRQDRAGIEAAIGALDDDQRAALVLFVFHDRTIAEIASILDVPPATIKTRLHRARQRLREAPQIVEAKDAS